jgi:hypothetical protein
MLVQMQARGGNRGDRERGKEKLEGGKIATNERYEEWWHAVHNKTTHDESCLGLPVRETEILDGV